MTASDTVKCTSFSETRLDWSSELQLSEVGNVLDHGTIGPRKCFQACKVLQQHIEINVFEVGSNDVKAVRLLKLDF